MTLEPDADNEWIMIGCEIIKAHEHAACALKKYRNCYGTTGGSEGIVNK